MADLTMFSWLSDFKVWLNVLFPLIAGICVYLVGWYLRLSKGTKSNLNEWLKAMDMWQMSRIVDGEQELRVVASVLRRYWYRYVYSACFFGVGLGQIALTIGSTLISLAIAGNLIGFDLMVPQGNDAPIMSALGVLFVTGAGGCAIMIGIWRAQREMASVLNYADLHQRRLSDYRPPAFLLVIGLLFVFLCGATALLFPYVGSFHWQLFENGRNLVITFSPALIFLAPVLVLSSLVLLEWVMIRVVRGARLLILPNPVVSQRTDDLLRASLIGFLLGGEFLVLAEFCVSLGSLGSTRALDQSSYGWLYHSLWAFGLVLFVCFLVFAHSYGGIGGRAFRRSVGRMQR